MLILLADLRFITPNRLTHISNALFVAGSLLILPVFGSHWLVAALLLNLSLSFDCADGQLARYRKGGSELGSFYDKVSDVLSLVLLFTVLGWVVVAQSGELKYFLFAILAFSGQLVSGYAKWVCMTARVRRGHAPVIGDEPSIPLWQYPGRVLLKVFRFAEPDLLFWVALGLLFDKLDWVLWLAPAPSGPRSICLPDPASGQERHALSRRAIKEYILDSEPQHAVALPTGTLLSTEPGIAAELSSASRRGMSKLNAAQHLIGLAHHE